jgi:hypothetical protein
MANSTVGHSGRFCNHIILNMFASMISERGGTVFTYSYKEEMEKLGLPLYTTGTITHEHTHEISLHDDSFDTLLDNPVGFNLKLNHTFVQNHAFSLRLFNYFHTAAVQEKIQKANLFTERYKNNDTVFVHVRLDDIKKFNPGYAYYEKALNTLGPVKGYIGTDSPEDPIIQDLLKNFQLELFTKDEVETIMFASTCKHLILSHGTFSWMIGALGFFSTVYVPPERFKLWCLQSFQMPGWAIVDPEENPSTL